MPIIHAHFSRPAFCCAASCTRRRRAHWLLALLFFLPMSLRAQVVADDIVGDWMVASRDAVVRISDHNGVYEGSLVWLLRSKYGIQDGAERFGHLIVDLHNPNPALRDRPLLGLTMLTDLKFDGRDGWDGGHVYNSQDGHTYGAKVTLLNHETLKLRGFLGIPLLGGSTLWTRVHQLPPAAD
jgi:uncharacterized protein (DUF2147 family)